MRVPEGGYRGEDPLRTKIAKLRGNELVEFYLGIEWYPRENDLIGGWCVMPLDEGPSGGIPEVADFMSERVAKYIAGLHNVKLHKDRAEKVDMRSDAERFPPPL